MHSSADKTQTRKDKNYRWLPKFYNYNFNYLNSITIILTMDPLLKLQDGYYGHIPLWLLCTYPTMHLRRSEYFIGPCSGRVGTEGGSCFPAQPEKPTTETEEHGSHVSQSSKEKGLLNTGLQAALCDPRAILVQRGNSLVKFCHLVKHFTTKCMA